VSDIFREVKIRRGSLVDVEAFRHCLDLVARERRWLAFLEAPPIEQVRSFLAQNALIQFLADHKGQIVGWCDVTANPREGFRHSGALGMGLLPAFRGGGLGRKLLRETVAAAQAAGIIRVELEVYPSNERAIALYESFGFVHEGRKKSARLLDGKAEDFLCMALVQDSM
jgi:ribosomal protein S18 acetylase RimI-like enzyme